jgi:soluble lytic murein transglycosylase
MGLIGPAAAEALDAQASLGPHGLYELALALNQMGLYPESIVLANGLSVQSPAPTIDDTPPCLQRLVYPLAYSDLVEQEAAKNGLDPYLLLGLLRQESWFGARAQSSAAASGLAQIVPSTGQDIARSLGQPGFTQQDLLRPSTAIAFGARYLSDQYQRFGRRALLALAAYNGGGGSVTRWEEGDPRIDADDFVQNIDFVETRTYVRSIYEIYGHYRALYG